MSAPVVCVGAVVRDDDRLLLIRRGQDPGEGRWSIPGGRVERGETLAEGVVRELAEETGCHGVCGELLGWTEIVDDEHHDVILAFVVTVSDATALRAGDDAIDAAWVPRRSVASHDLVDGLADFLVEHGVIELSGPSIAGAASR